MIDLANLVEDTDGLWGNVLVELIASQVVARLAYSGSRVFTLDEVNAQVHEVVGYPIKNRFSRQDVSDTVLDRAARRAADLIGINWRDQLEKASRPASFPTQVKS